jgi:hypothetical protein
MSTESETDDGRGDVTAATRVVFSYPADLSQWGRDGVAESSFKSYLRKAIEPLEEGRVFDEFVGVGCCGNSLEVPLRIESVEGGDEMGPDTDIDYTVREASGIEGGWQVQSKEGPTE